MYEVKKDGVILARQIFPEDMKPGLNFYSQDEEYIQVGVWGHYEEGKYLQKHIHNEVERSAKRTYEVIYLISGSLDADIFDLEENFVEKLTIKQGEALILLENGHGYTITSEDTTVLEAKNGPFLGKDVDKKLF